MWKVKCGMREWNVWNVTAEWWVMCGMQKVSLSAVPPFPFVPSSFPFSLVLRALGVLRMLPVLQRLGDTYSF